MVQDPAPLVILSVRIELLKEHVVPVARRIELPPGSPQIRIPADVDIAGDDIVLDAHQIDRSYRPIVVVLALLRRNHLPFAFRQRDGRKGKLHGTLVELPYRMIRDEAVGGGGVSDGRCQNTQRSSKQPTHALPLKSY